MENIPGLEYFLRHYGGNNKIPAFILETEQEDLVAETKEAALNCRVKSEFGVDLWKGPKNRMLDAFDTPGFLLDLADNFFKT